MEISAWEVLAFTHLAAAEVQGHSLDLLVHGLGDLGGTPAAPCDALSLLAPLLLWVQPENWGAVAVLSTSGQPRVHCLPLESCGEAEAAALWAAPWKMLRAGSITESCWGAGCQGQADPLPAGCVGRGCWS